MFQVSGVGNYTLKCPNKRIMMMRDNGDVESESDKSHCEDMQSLEDCSKDELTLPIEESLVIRHTLQA